MFHWLRRWGGRLWRSCCYPFQVLASKLSRTQHRPETSTARNLPSSRSEAIRQGILPPPGTRAASELVCGNRKPETGELTNGLPKDKSFGATAITGPEAVVENSRALFEQPAGTAPQNASQFTATTSTPQPVQTPERAPRPAAKLAPQAAVAKLPLSWVLEQRLAIGPMPKKSWALGLQGQGIRVVLSLCDEAEGKLPKAIAQQFRCIRVPLPDSRYRRSLALDELEEAVDLIHWHLQKQQPVYLHCLAGIERSPLVAIAYLCRYRAMDLLDAVGWLSHVHGRSRPLPAQLQVVRDYLQKC